MAQKQQALINCLNKLVRQYFLYRDDPGKDQIRVRLRNDLHRVEQASALEHNDKLLQRLANDSIGLLHPDHKPYVPVAGWPVLNLDDLVLTALAPQLDPKVRQALRNQLDKTEIKRVHERTMYKDILSDYTVIHQNPTSGFHKIKTHIAESEARMLSVRAGFTHEQHFKRTLEERQKRETKTEETVRQFNADSDFFLAMERERKDMILFLNTLKDLLEKVLLVRVRHLKSHSPINLGQLGADRTSRITRKGRVSTTASMAMGARSPGRSPPFPGNTAPTQHCFRGQILAERPAHWPVKVVGLVGGPGARVPQWRGARSSQPSFSIARPSEQPTLTPAKDASLSACAGNWKRRQTGQTAANTVQPTAVGQNSLLSSESHSAGSEGREDTSGVSSSLRQRGTTDREMVDKFRKVWPPVWMGLAAMEQGNYIVDPACPSKEYTQCLHGPHCVRHHKSLSNILDTRREWAAMRKQVSRTVDENLWREDMEKLESYRVEYSTLAHVPLSKPYDNHQREMEELLKSSRLERQKRVIFDCELSDWYKYLVERVQDEVGEKDEEINAVLESIKVYFNMSATSPKLGKAKLALIVMSMPAYVVCQLHVQRAVTFILTKVMQAPAPLFTGWLSTRGLPLVLAKSQTI